ncbi:hypothetical protein MSG28_012764 [Choristoneura fumiferana]|uniref:Uncharacterized protein n=1 Tax=Choristoneura fumiferana TaxID=7141 RepID=A0ACC0JI71_CHOFU|nr:hypothetical protein MSG28_012764 [Choristoneura fumiferana]
MDFGGVADPGVDGGTIWTPFFAACQRSPKKGYGTCVENIVDNICFIKVVVSLMILLKHSGHLYRNQETPITFSLTSSAKHLLRSVSLLTPNAGWPMQEISTRRYFIVLAERRPLLDIGLPKALHSDRSCAFRIHRDPAILTRSSLHLVGGLPTARLLVRGRHSRTFLHHLYYILNTNKT